MVGTHDTDAELLLLLVLFLYFFAPFKWMACVVVLPGFHLDEAPREVCQVVQCPSHGAEDTRNGFLARHARVHTHFRPSPRGAAYRIAAGEMCWRAYRTCDIRPYAYATATEC